MRQYFSEKWREITAATVGTKSYWYTSLQALSFYNDMGQVISRHASGRILDVGAGKLAWRDLLMPYASDYISADFVIEHPELDLAVDIITGLPFPDKSFDTVFCCSVLEHVAQPWKAFEEICRILVPGGNAIISLPFLFPVHDEPQDYFRFTRFGIEALAKKQGLKIVEVVVNGGLFHLVLNLASVITSIVLDAAKMRFLTRPATRAWLGLANALENSFQSKKSFASNHIVVLRKLVDLHSFSEGQEALE